MAIVTSEYVAGHHIIETRDGVFGTVVRSRGLDDSITAGLRSIIGGEIHEHTHMLEEARRHACVQM